VHYLTPDFLAQCELSRVHLPTPNSRYAHNFYREKPAFVAAYARILNEQGDLYHIGQNAATTLASSGNSESIQEFTKIQHRGEIPPQTSPISRLQEQATSIRSGIVAGSVAV
jgi:hypothetical protein